MRASVLDVINQDYIKTAKAKGLSKPEIVWRHIIRNAILPIVTILGPLVANIITGTLVVEAIFNIPGLGKYYVQSIYNSDYTLIMGTTIFYAIILLVSTFLVDLAYGFIDPRIRLAKGKE
jgi:oligopeptide transport system permease protein